MRYLVLVLLFLSVNLHAGLKASVSATKIKINQSLQLKLASDNAAGKQPNLTKLKRNFKIVGSSKVSRPYVSNNQRMQKTLWYYIIKPKRSGQVTIPKLSVNGQSSKAITIQVIPLKRTVSKPKAVKKVTQAETYDIVVSAKASKTKLYPHEILVYELSVNYPKKNAVDFSVTPPFVGGAVILPLREASYEEKMQRSKARIIRKQSFAIFAEQVALYQIEPASISFQYRQSPQKPIVLKANSLRFEVMPKANQTSLGYWIPSEQIKLRQEWQLNERDTPQNYQVGDSVKRTISLEVQGVNADILPLISTLTHQDMQIKLEDVIVENKVIDGVMLATRREVVSMTFKSPGQINIPPIDIHWWNTALDQARLSSLNPKSFIVDEKAVIETPELPPQTDPVAEQIIEKEVPSPSSDEVKAPPKKEPRKLFSAQQTDIIIIILFCLLVATTLGWLISSRKRR